MDPEGKRFGRGKFITFTFHLRFAFIGLVSLAVFLLDFGAYLFMFCV